MNNEPYLPLKIVHTYNKHIIISRKWIHKLNNFVVIERLMDCTNINTIISDIHKCFYFTGYYFDIDNSALYKEIFETPVSFAIQNKKTKKIHNPTTYYEMFAHIGEFEDKSVDINGIKRKVHKYPKHLLLWFDKTSKRLIYKVKKMR